MFFSEHDRVQLRKAKLIESLPAGAVGTIVQVYLDQQEQSTVGYEVEFECHGWNKVVTLFPDEVTEPDENQDAT